MAVNDMNNYIEIIEEYKKYIQNNVLNNSFDFDTWCQHQFGESPQNISVSPEIKFNLVSKPEHK
jgi:hypothetical protein